MLVVNVVDIMLLVWGRLACMTAVFALLCYTSSQGGSSRHPQFRTQCFACGNTMWLQYMMLLLFVAHKISLDMT